MAIKIRCTSCSKKISVDDAFAGGMCRCPYCTATVSVPDKRPRGKGGRPGSPDVRPDAPPVELVEPVEPVEPAAAPATEASTPAVAAHQIPVANPVRTQWVLLVVLLAVMIACGIAAAMWLARQRGRQQANGEQVEVKDVNPFDTAAVAATGKAAIAGMEIRAPVVYCIDNGEGMHRIFDLLSAMTQVSIESLGPDRRFALLVCARRDARGDERTWEMPGGYHAGGAEGRAKADGFLADVDWFADVDLPGTIAKALEIKAKTIVFCGRAKVADPKQLGAKAKAGGATIVTIAITNDDEAAASLAALAEASGGQTRRLGLDELEAWIQSAN